MLKEFVENGEDIRIYIGKELVYEGKYSEENLYSEREVYSIGYETVKEIKEDRYIDGYISIKII